MVRNDFRPSLSVDEVDEKGIRALPHGDLAAKLSARGRGGR